MGPLPSCATLPSAAEELHDSVGAEGDARLSTRSVTISSWASSAKGVHRRLLGHVVTRGHQGSPEDRGPDELARDAFRDPREARVPNRRTNSS